MSGLIGLVVFLIFAFIWYFPLYRSKPADKRPEPKLFWKAFFMGLGPAFLVGLILPFLIGYILKAAGYTSDDKLFKLMISGVGYGIGEELSKFLIAYLVMKKAGFKNKSYSALLFGAVGLGFGVLESFMVVSNIISALVRGIFSLHVFFQLWMGLFYGDSLEKKEGGDVSGAKRSMLLAFAVPMLVHIIHDVVGYQGLDYMVDGGDGMVVLGLALFIGAVVVDIVFIVSTLIKVKKA